MLLNAIKNVLYVDFMDELRKILIILSLWEILHILRGFVLLHSCWGQTSREEPEPPGPAGGASSAPPHPHTELSTHPLPQLGSLQLRKLYVVKLGNTASCWSQKQSQK